MQTNVLEYLEYSAQRFPEKTAYADADSKLSFGELLDMARRIGSSAALAVDMPAGPVPVLLKKSPMALAGFFGVMYSGNAYVPLDVEMPAARLSLIKENLKPKLVLTDRAHEATAREIFGESIAVLTVEEALEKEADDELLLSIGKRHLDTDPAYVLYTSGSTGVPKGVVVSHRSLIDYMDSFCPAVGVRSEDVIASQAPFYFDASLIDIYCTLKMGATLHIVPLEFFSIPLRLMEFLQDKKITMIRWVPSAMGIVSTFKAFKSLRPDSLRLIIFGAESMPMKCFNYWRENYPEADFVQIYGPTEITGICTYHHITGDVSDFKVLPIGRALYNSGVFLLDEKDGLIDEKDAGRVGEICVKGTCLAHGYYNDPERTAAVFVQNPLNPYYPERIYRTGDMASYNEDGDLVFAGRRDFQIKHMGHRIELGEIENAAASLDIISRAACFFDEKKNKIHMAYEAKGESEGKADEAAIMAALGEKLPKYMIPNVYHPVENLPQTATGKADRGKLKEMFL
ncbi:MAG: amino acid adenylation domain-containing protein [Lachnospiraceae bacterium]|nr:amino acid adenylation domain-containing protein [Lachnospiraceae bacterium]